MDIMFNCFGIWDRYFIFANIYRIDIRIYYLCMYYEIFGITFYLLYWIKMKYKNKLYDYSRNIYIKVEQNNIKRKIRKIQNKYNNHWGWLLLLHGFSIPKNNCTYYGKDSFTDKPKIDNQKY